MAAVDLGTNGEVMVTDGTRILTGSTAAGPAFEGVNISCGSRAVDGAIVDVRLNGSDFVFETIANEPPVGVTGSGLLSLTQQLVQAGVIEPTGRISPEPARAWPSGSAPTPKGRGTFNSPTTVNYFSSSGTSANYKKQKEPSGPPLIC